MSATLLRDGATADLQALIDSETAILVAQREHPLDVMRERQGYIRGLKDAQQVIRAREQNPMADR